MTRARRSAGAKAGLAAAIALSVLLPACRPSSPNSVPQQPPARGRQPLQRDLTAILGAAPLDRGYWGVLIKSLKSGETLYTLNARKLMLPASNLKIVTLAAAAERLGWNFTYETKIQAVGTISEGVLDGDLLVIGSGDPSLTETAAAPVFAGWAAQLKAAGISAVTGRIIGDDNTFDDEPLGMGWSWDDLPEAFAAGIGALQFNENMARVTVAPGAGVGAPASLTIEPTAAGLVVRNHMVTGDAQSSASVRIRRPMGTGDLEVRGSWPLGNAASARLVSVDNPTMFFVSALKTALAAGGVEVRGAAVDIDDIGDAPARTSGATVISHQSPPLSTLAIRLMKNSQNQYGETLLRTLGVNAGTPSAAGGAAAAAAILKNWGVGDGELIQRDGSGLSRYDYTTAEAFVTILEHVDRDPRLKGPFEQSLPIAGVDGSLVNRMKGTAAEKNARAKTGSMSNVRGLAGYVTSADGEPLVFSILANNFEAPADVVNAASDAIVVRLAQFRR